MFLTELAVASRPKVCKIQICTFQLNAATSYTQIVEKKVEIAPPSKLPRPALCYFCNSSTHARL